MVFVYYEDDHCEMGGHGLKECKDRAEAEAFLLERRAGSASATPWPYTVIEGEKLTISTVETVTKIRLD